MTLEWIEQVSVKVDAADEFAAVPATARPLIRLARAGLIVRG